MMSRWRRTGAFIVPGSVGVPAVVRLRKAQAVGKSEDLVSLVSMPAEVKRPPQNFSRNSTSSFRDAVRDALNLAPFPKGGK